MTLCLPRLLPPVTIGALLVALCLPVTGDVTIRGRVEFYDSLRGDYRPARQVRVMAKGNWNPATRNPRGHTDDSGRFTLTQRDPIVGRFDISIRVYARTYTEHGCKIRVSSRMGAFRPYNVTSAAVLRVAGGETCTINLRIGGPQNNAVATHTHSFAENANAFLLHQETLEHYRTLKAMGFPAWAFQRTRIIAPAAGFLPYYWHLSDYVNMTHAGLTNPGTMEFSAGIGDWSTIHSGDSEDIAYPFVLRSMRHEVSHRIHRRLTEIAPLGLNMPARHHPNMQTNRFLAFTEGVAEFLPRAATLGMPGNYGPTPPGWNIPANAPPPGNFAWQGEVTSLLLDLTGPVNTTRRMRFPATQSVNERVRVPAALQDAQEWTLRISDPDLTRIRRVLGMPAAAGTRPVETVRQFLNGYLSEYPEDALGLKVAAYNRCLPVEGLPQNAPHIDGSISLQRVGDEEVQVSFDIIEEDPEDRSIVKAYYWWQRYVDDHHGLGGSNEIMPPVTYDTGWNGNRRSVTERLTFPPASEIDMSRIWIVVSDEMLSSAYWVDIPAADDTTPVATQVPRLEVPRLPHVTRPRAPQPELELPELRFDAEAEGRIRALQDALDRAEAEIETYAEHTELVSRIERTLYGLGRAGGTIEPNDTFRPGITIWPSDNFRPLIEPGDTFRPRIEPGDTFRPRIEPGDTFRPELIEGRPGIRLPGGDETQYARWLSRLSEGEPLPQAITPAVQQEALAEDLQLLNAARQHCTGAADRLESIINDILTTIGDLALGEESELIWHHLQQVVDELYATQAAMRADQDQISTTIETQQSAIRGLLAAEVTPVVETPAPTVPRPVGDAYLYSFGHNAEGRLGQGDTSNRHVPTRIEGLGPVRSFAAAGSHRYSVVVLEDGQVYSFGSNSYHALGHGDTEDRHVPTIIQGLGPARAVAAGGGHSLVLMEDGTVYSFGYHRSGQLGRDTPRVAESAIPGQVEGIGSARAVAAGGEHSLVLLESGEVYCFGRHGDGELGLGRDITGGTPVPTRIDGLEPVQALSAGRSHSLLLTTDGRVYAFGRNDHGQLGLGDTDNRFTPTLITGLEPAVAIAAGGSHSLVVLESGDIVSFGRNTNGQLGHGPEADRFNPCLTPTPVAGISAAQTVAAGMEHSLILLQNGDVYGFGRNVSGELGWDPTGSVHPAPVYNSMPAKIEGIGPAKAVSVGHNFSLVLAEYSGRPPE